MEPSPKHVVVGAQRGFTLVELIVVLAIIVLLTYVTITSQTSYNRQLLLTSTTYTVALSIREAQSLGLSSRSFGNIQDAGYGVHFAKATPTQYSIFSDVLSTQTVSQTLCSRVTDQTSPEGKPGNCFYDGSSEVATSYNLNKGFSITDFCGLSIGSGGPGDNSGTRYCASTSTSAGLSTLDIVFLRPNTETIMIGATSGGNKVGLMCAMVWVSSPDATTKKCIMISKVGQVSVPQTCPQTPTAFTSC